MVWTVWLEASAEGWRNLATPRPFYLVGVVACRSYLHWSVEALSESLAPQGTPTDVTVSKSECSKQPACRLNVKAWNNKGSTTVASFCWFSSLSAVTSRRTTDVCSQVPLGAGVQSPVALGINRSAGSNQYFGVRGEIHRPPKD